MIEKTGNITKNLREENFINTSKIEKKNIYSKIAPPNTFKRRNTNKIAPTIMQRYANNSQYNQISNPFIYYNSNFSKRSSLILNNQNNLGLNIDSNVKLSQNINSSFREKIKIVKGNLFNNEPNNIISPKKIVNEKMKIINNKNDNNDIKLPNQYLGKYKSVYSKKGNNQILKKYNHMINVISENTEQKNINKDNSKNKININNDCNFIKDRYDYLLERAKNLLSNYQQIIEYYQEKEKKNENKTEHN